MINIKFNGCATSNMMGSTPSNRNKYHSNGGNAYENVLPSRHHNDCMVLGARGADD